MDLTKKLQKNLFFKEQVIASFLLSIPLVSFGVGSLCLMLGFQVSSFLFPLSFLLSTLTITLLFKKKESQKTIGLNIAYASVFFLICILISNYFYDVSFDGQWYHQDAIILLSEGWNPFHDIALINNQTSGNCAPYLNHYPKASWIAGACLYKFTNSIQIAKAFNLVFILSTFFYCFYFLSKWLKTSKTSLFICSFILSFSTIAFGQSLTYYVDGQIASLLLILIFLLIDYVKSEMSISKLILLSFLVFYGVNIKFTSLIYILLFCFVAFIYILLKKRTSISRFLIQQSFVFSLAIFVFGHPTYVSNTIEKNHPFYPIMGENNEGKRIAEIPYAKNFFNKNRFEKFYLSGFAIPEWTDPKLKASQAKKLFDKKIAFDEKNYFKNTLPMPLSPTGPLHGELLIFLIPLLVLFISKKQKTVTYFVFSGLLFSILIQPEFWNYRYTPQIWFFYVGLILFGLIHANKWIKYYAFFVLLLAFFNVGITHKQYLSYNFEKTSIFQSEIEQMKNKKVCIKKGWMQSFEYRLKENNLDYHFCEDQKDYKSFEGGDFSNWQYKIVNK